MHAEMATATSASWRLMEPVPTGSVQLPVEAERYTIIIHHSDCGTHAVNKQLGCVRVLFGIGLEHVGLRPTTIALLWRERKPTCTRTDTVQPCHTSFGL